MNHQQTFVKRSKPKISEGKCEKYLDKNNIYYKRFGWDYNEDQVPGNQFVKIPDYMRARPDYIIFTDKAYFLEVKGCKNYLGLKICDMRAYAFWNMVMDLYFFIYSSLKNTIYKLSYKQMSNIVRHCEVEVYKDNEPKHYYKVKLEYLEKRAV